MKQIDVAEAIQRGVEQVLFKQWRHEGYISLLTEDAVEFVVDDRKYILKLEDVT